MVGLRYKSTYSYSENIMRKEDVLLIGKFFSEGRGVAFPLFEFEEELGIKRELILRSLAIFKKLGAGEYRVIPWNPSDPNEDDVDIWKRFAKSSGINKPKTQSEKTYHINDEGVMVLFNLDKLKSIINHPERITDELLEEAKFYPLPTFDEKKSELKFEDKECPIPPSTHQFYLCKAIFSPSHKIGDWITEQEILDHIDMENTGPRTVYDAMLAVNKLVRARLGVDKFIKMENSRFRIRKELFK